MPSPNRQRDFAEQVVRQLRADGHEALWAGGCVRDELLGRTPKDYDVATSARPEQVRALFGRKRTLAIGAAFGVVSVLGSKQHEPIEVATFRSDGAYLDGRHPTEVTFTTAEQDAQRRDFTINGLFCDPLTGKLIDYVDGQHDLEQGIIRAIGDPSARFSEDKLRMMRAVRFATTFNFAIDGATLAAIQSMAAEIEVVSAERIGAELRKILQHSERSRGVQLLVETGLMDPLLPTLADSARQDTQNWRELLGRLRAVRSDAIAVAFATLLSGSRNPDLVRDRGRSFRFTNKEIDRAAWLVDNIEIVEKAASLSWPKLQRILIHEGIEDLLALTTAIFGAQHGGVLVCRNGLALPAERLDPRPLLSGDDLVAHGLKPGKYFGELLEYIRDAQLEETVKDSRQALNLAERWLRDHPSE